MLHIVLGGSCVTTSQLPSSVQECICMVPYGGVAIHCDSTYVKGVCELNTVHHILLPMLMHACIYTCLGFDATGKLSGQAAVTSRLKGLGYSLTKEQMVDIFIRFKVCIAWTAAFKLGRPLMHINAWPGWSRKPECPGNGGLSDRQLTSMKYKLFVLRH